MSNRAERIAESRVASSAAEWYAAERSHEISRLERIVRNPVATPDERRIAADMLAGWNAIPTL